MNNKGFAITTVLYGTLILFCLLLVSMLGILATYKNNLDKLINETNGARELLTMTPKYINNIDEINGIGLYCIYNIGCRFCANSDCFQVYR